ncbi:MAG TPA: sigma-70 family RNA polymerase sigma factor [Isosphaeraceae bacterium]|jgi:RNA polymerase sigma-70 factor (ECF subfamily)|nr:sigma-70 family RNA polymerase sigma factor [Isosphaeraceae bacterium]
MASVRGGAVFGRIQRLLESGAAGAMSDAELLTRFASRKDDGAEEAFEVLVRRHGPMVLRVCRRELGDFHLAQDAFQATFLILARKAGAIRQDNALAGWLLSVARRMASRARTESNRRRRLDQIGAELAARHTVDDFKSLPLELRDELDQLPERYRRPLELCYLKGLTHEEAAIQLRCPVGTVRSRLSRGREALRSRLADRGLILAPLVPARAEPLSATLIRSTLHAVMSPSTAPENALRLMKGALAMMSRMQLTKVVVLTLSVSLLTATMILARPGSDPTTDRSREPATRNSEDQAKDPVKVELDRLKGRWRRVASEADGKDWMPKGSIDPDNPALVVVFEGNAWRILKDDGQTLETAHTVTLDPEAKPKQMSLGAADDAGKVLFRAIYKLEDDTLTLCIQFNRDAPLPDDFVTRDGDGRVLDVYERAKP